MYAYVYKCIYTYRYRSTWLASKAFLEARRSEGVIQQLLQGVEILAKPSEEWQKDLMQKGGEVPLEMMRGGDRGLYIYIYMYIV